MMTITLDISPSIQGLQIVGPSGELPNKGLGSVTLSSWNMTITLDISPSIQGLQIVGPFGELPNKGLGSVTLANTAWSSFCFHLMTCQYLDCIV
jgi:hypothetical protein